jgi:hypothetical protein
MKKLLAGLFCLIFIFATLSPSAFAQTRRHRRFGTKARTAAIIGGGTAVGALVGGKKGAAIGGGGTALYAMNRRSAQRHFSRRTRTIGTVAGGTALGAGVGGALGHGKGAAVGAIAGAGGSYLYDKRRRQRGQ